MLFGFHCDGTGGKHVLIIFIGSEMIVLGTRPQCPAFLAPSFCGTFTKLN